MNGLAEYGLILAAAIAGALIRHGAVVLGGRARLPIAVLLVNAVGSLIAGAAVGAASVLPAGVSVIIVSGFCGALTTFSTFSVDTVRLALTGRVWAAIWNVLSNLALGLGCAALGAAVALAIV